jgi:hypothetical protein
MMPSIPVCIIIDRTFYRAERLSEIARAAWLIGISPAISRGSTPMPQEEAELLATVQALEQQTRLTCTTGARIKVDRLMRRHMDKLIN